jgi:quercetin dioxygenase-like cupin family protein
MDQLIANAATTEPTTTPDGAQRRVLSHGGSMMAVQFTFEAGQRGALHSHPHEQIGYVVAGELDLLMNGHDPVRLTAGCSYYVPPNTEHGVIIHAPTILLDVFTPQRKEFL